MARVRQLLAGSALLLAWPVWAQTTPGGIAPLPFESPQQRITPMEPDANEAGILTTKKTPILPWNTEANPAPAPAVAGGIKVIPVAPLNAPSAAPTVVKPGLPAVIPFGRSSMPSAPIVPEGPHATTAVPIENVEHIDQSDTPAAPPTPVAPAADPANQDPTQPTDLTAPLFNAPDTGAARTVVLRALNKVSAQAVTLEARPGDSVKFGQLIIIPITCRMSDPSSQLDYAGLLDIKENVPGKDGLVPRFHGWMYASSPSINALEHPVYDISITECRYATAPKKDEEKPAKKPEKKVGKK